MQAQLRISRPENKKTTTEKQYGRCETIRDKCDTGVQPFCGGCLICALSIRACTEKLIASFYNRHHTHKMIHDCDEMRRLCCLYAFETAFAASIMVFSADAFIYVRLFCALSHSLRFMVFVSFVGWNCRFFLFSTIQTVDLLLMAKPSPAKLAFDCLLKNWCDHIHIHN